MLSLCLTQVILTLSKKVDKQDALPAVNSIDADEMLKGVFECRQDQGRQPQLVRMALPKG